VAGEDPEYVHWVKRQRCAAATFGGCSGGFVHAHHAGERGLGKRAHDETCVPLCSTHHRAWHDLHQPFRHMPRPERMAWIAAQICGTRHRYRNADGGESMAF